MRRRDVFADFLDPLPRFFLGTGLLVLFLFSNGLQAKLIQVLLFYVLAQLSGKKVRPLYYLLLLFWITLFQLLTPWGEVLVDLSFLRITRGSLETGLSKGLTLVGMVFASLFSVSSELRLPGNAGLIVAQMLLSYEQLYNGKHRIRRRSLLPDLDALLEDSFPVASKAAHEDIAASGGAGGWRVTPPGVLLIFLSLGFVIVTTFVWPGNGPAGKEASVGSTAEAGANALLGNGPAEGNR